LYNRADDCQQFCLSCQVINFAPVRENKNIEMNAFGWNLICCATIFFRLFHSGKRRQTSDFRSRFRFLILQFPHPWISNRNRISRPQNRRFLQGKWRLKCHWLKIDRKKTFTFTNDAESDLKWAWKPEKCCEKFTTKAKLVFCLVFTLNSSWFNPHKRIIVVDSLFTDSNKSNHHFSLSFSVANNGTNGEKINTQSIYRILLGEWCRHVVVVVTNPCNSFLNCNKLNMGCLQSVRGRKASKQTAAALNGRLWFDWVSCEMPKRFIFDVSKRFWCET
jgi:hypothetical protein